MKKFISASSALLATAMMVTLSVGCGEGIEGETGSQSAELNRGQCNAIVATSLRSAQRCARGECGADECEDVTGAFFDFLVTNPECADFLGMGGLTGNAVIHPQTGEGKHVGDVICGSVLQCGLCPIAPDNVCAEDCQEPEG